MRFVSCWTRSAGSVCLAICLAFGLRQEAISATININFGGPDNSTYTGAAAIGNSGDFWNQVSSDPSNVSLKDSGSNNTSVTFTNTYGVGITNFGFQFGFDNTQYKDLMRGYLVNLDSDLEVVPLTFTIGGLDPSKSFDLYIYTQGDEGADGRRLSVTVGGSTVVSNPAVWTANTFILGQNYLKLSGLTPNANGDIVAIWQGVGGEANINGLQLTEASGNAAVPEPASIVIFGLGALGMAYRTRRKARA